MAVVDVSGFEEFVKAVDRNQGKSIFAYFTGSKGADGVSWCEDCVRAEPIVRAELDKLPEGSVFICCQTGTRPEWKNLENKFRTELKITKVPTLMRYGTGTIIFGT
ncbi:thioredoxin domain-containing protein 17 isoform X2 [Narcine bancroftii]|uniref:thioredoxin domain-containing protein 17 isoform X2 n=1 Tax=Narcine bancroftii TaxID=1343680 RepID=UPI0038322E6D